MSDSATPSASYDESWPQEENQDRRLRFRWKLGLAIPLLGALVEIVTWTVLSPNRTSQVFASMPILSATAFLTVLWWLFLSGLRWKVRLAGLGVLLLAVVTFFVAVRIDGFEGDMLPIMSFRWHPSAEDRAEEYWRQQAAKGNGAGGDLSGSAAAEPLMITDADWPEFRGSQRDGIVRNGSLRRNWDTRPPELLWRHPVGLGWSSFAVVGNLAITQEQRGDEEAVVCYDFESGEQIWVHTDSARFVEALGGVGPRATPTVHDSRVYALGATGILNCLDARTGKRHWTTNVLEDGEAENLTWAMAGSPLVFDDKVVVNPGGQGGAYIAYDRLTGEPIWKSGDEPAAYVSPQLVTIEGVREIVVHDGDGVVGLDPETGRELWRFPWSNDQKINATQPTAINDRSILISTGYGVGAALLEVEQGAEFWKVHPAPRWTSRYLKMKFNSGVVRDGFVYGLDDGILTCLDLNDGSRRWQARGYGYGQMLLVDDLLLILADTGEVVLVEATPDEHRRLAAFQAIDGKTWNHPVLCRGRLLVRNGQEAACYDVSAPELHASRRQSEGEH